MLGFEFDVLTGIDFWVVSLKKGESVWDAGKKVMTCIVGG